MADKLLIIMVNSDPKNPSELGSPLFQATVAAAMEYEVEIVLTGRSGELAVKGVAENIMIRNKDSHRSLYSVIQEAHEGAYIVSEAMDDATVTLTY